MTFKAPKKCPCGNGLYRKCCGRFHPLFAGENVVLPKNVELLMRSRYSAFALGMADYLLDTWHPSTRPSELDFSDLDFKLAEHKIAIAAASRAPVYG